MEYTIVSVQKWKRVCPFKGNLHGNSQSIFGEWDLILGRNKETDKARQAVLVPHLHPFGNKTRWRKNPHDDYTVPQKSTLQKLVGKHNQDAVYWIKDYPERRIKDCNSGKRSRLQSSPVTLCQEIAFTERFLKTEIEYFPRGSQHQGQHPRLRWRAVGLCSSLLSRKALIASRKR